MFFFWIYSSPKLIEAAANLNKHKSSEEKPTLIVSLPFCLFLLSILFYYNIFLSLHPVLLSILLLSTTHNIAVYFSIFLPALILSFFISITIILNHYFAIDCIFHHSFSVIFIFLSFSLSVFLSFSFCLSFFLWPKNRVASGFYSYLDSILNFKLIFCRNQKTNKLGQKLFLVCY